MADGVSFTGKGGEELRINQFTTIPSEPSRSGGGDGVSFVDNASGDDVKPFGTDQRAGLDKSSHDTDGGKGVQFIKDLR